MQKKSMEEQHGMSCTYNSMDRGATHCLNIIHGKSMKAIPILVVKNKETPRVFYLADD